MIQLLLVNINYEVVVAPTGDRVLVFADRQSGVQVQIPMDNKTVDDLKAKLSGLTLASQIPNGKST